MMLCAATGAPAAAQAPWEIEVYGAATALPRSVIVELHSNYDFRGPTAQPGCAGPPVVDDNRVPTAGGVNRSAAQGCAPPPLFLFEPRSPGVAFASQASVSAPATRAVHETFEIVAGAGTWLEFGGYVFSSVDDSAGFLVAGGSLRAKARVPGSWRWPIGLALSSEIEHERAAFSVNTWSWEIRPVIDMSAGRWYISVNPTLVRTVAGPGTANGVQFSPSGKAAFDLTRGVSAGIEYYGALGELGAFPPASSRLQQIYAAFDLHSAAVWEVNAGVGFGITPATNQLMVKALIGRRITW